MSNNETPNRVQVAWNILGGDSGIDKLMDGTNRLIIVDATLEGDALLVALQAAAQASKNTTYLRYLASATLAPTKGNVTLAQSADDFTGHLDPDFKNWGTDVAGIDTQKAPADIYEMGKKNGTFAQIFGSLVGVQGSYEEIAVACRPLCLQQGQITEFSVTHKAMLRQDGYATLFLFEVEIDGEPVLFVAHVGVDGGELGAHVRRFSSGSVWRADDRSRVVVPQLAV